MASDKSRRPQKKAVSKRGMQKRGREPSATDKRVWQVLEKARQEVKPLVKRELEGEKVPADLLNFRLKGNR